MILNINNKNKNTKNLLADITPIFAGWNTNPGTNVDLTNELTIALTTPGVQTNAINSTIVYDLGSSQRIVANVYRSGVATSASMELSLSDNGINYYIAGRNLNTSADQSCAILGKGRYLMVTLRATATGNTISELPIRAYSI